MTNDEKNKAAFRLTHEEHHKIFEGLQKQYREHRNRVWTPEEFEKYQKEWDGLIKKMIEKGVSREEIEKVDRERSRCLKGIRTLIPKEVPELNKVEVGEIESAVSLLKNPRAWDNSLFRGYEASPQQNDTLDLLVQVKRQIQASKTALAKLKEAGLSPERDITKNKIVRLGQFASLKGAEVLARTKDTLTLVKGRSLFIYELKRLELKAPAEGNPGEKLDLRWPEGQEKARGTQALEQEQRRTRGRSQQEER